MFIIINRALKILACLKQNGGMDFWKCVRAVCGFLWKVVCFLFNVLDAFLGFFLKDNFWFILISKVLVAVVLVIFFISDSSVVFQDF